ncbi:MAG: protein kinase [Myxococcales bacterium]|nr:protein kinase [Myxococcales bacterium]
MAASEDLSAPISKTIAHERPRHRAGFEPLTVVSQGPDGSAVLALDPDGALVELRFVSAVRADADRWSALEQRCALMAMLDPKISSLRCLRTADLDGADPLIVLDPPEEDTLQAWLDAQPRLTIDVVRVADILESLSFALGAAHRLGLAHGRLSPETITMTPAGLPLIELSGTACNELTSNWARVCIAPEVVAGGAAEPASDLYSLAMVGLGLLVGGDPTDEAHRVTAAGVTEGLRGILASALVRNPDERPSAAEWTLAIREWKQTKSTGSAITTGIEANPSEPPKLAQGVQLGRYYLMKLLGEGGMGEVWEGMDLGTSASVAIKVMRPEVARDPVFLRRFRKEARTLATVRNPYIANLVELNEDADRHYLVMEFIAGRSLGAVLSEQKTIDEREALAIIADACRALVEPHRVGIVHRDLKPDNLLFLRADEPLRDGDPTRQRIKVCDFGIARDSEQPDLNRAHATKEGTIIGTPQYMAPEQCRGQIELVPATDVYALGCTLFELVTGKVPFDADVPMDVVLLHLTSPVPKVRDVAPSVSEHTAAIIERALAKEPADRYADARAMLDAIETALRGTSDIVELHPKLPQSKPGWTRRFVFEFDLDASVEELWPYVANTDKMNRAAGLAPVKYDVRGVTPGVSERVGSNSALGIPLRWREHPYEWIERKRHAVFREFQSGPVLWYSAEVELQSLAPTKTRVRHTITLHPRNWLGYFAAPIEVGFKYRRALSKAYRRLDALLGRARVAALPAGTDPLQPDVNLSRAASERLDKAARAAIGRGADAAVVEALCQYLRTASDNDVARVRPYAVADELGLSRDLVAEACLVLCREGALVMLWDVLCPSCKISTSVAESLDAVRSHASCVACNIDFSLDFSSSIELVFRPHTSVRAVETRTFCAGGPGHFPHVVAQLRLAPGERFDLELALPAGRYKVRSAQLSRSIDLHAKKGGALRRADVRLGDLDGEENKKRGDLAIVVAEGAQVLSLTNTLERELLLRVERATESSSALTAAKASATRSFREMFPGQVLAAGALVSVASMTLLTTSIDRSGALFDELGDNAAYAAVLEHLRVIEEVTAAHHGALLKTVGARTVSAFEDAQSAVEAALSLARELAKKPSLAKLALRIAVHRGPMMAATIGDKLDYFGRNAELAFSLVDELSRPATLLTQAVADDPGVRTMLLARSVRRTPRKLRSLGLDAWGVELDL